MANHVHGLATFENLRNAISNADGVETLARPRQLRAALPEPCTPPAVGARQSRSRRCTPRFAVGVQSRTRGPPGPARAARAAAARCASPHTRPIHRRRAAWTRGTIGRFGSAGRQARRRRDPVGGLAGAARKSRSEPVPRRLRGRLRSLVDGVAVKLVAKRRRARQFAATPWGIGVGPTARQNDRPEAWDGLRSTEAIYDRIRAPSMARFWRPYSDRSRMHWRTMIR